jgi:hypothetical protein
MPPVTNLSNKVSNLTQSGNPSKTFLCILKSLEHRYAHFLGGFSGMAKYNSLDISLN